MFATQTGLFPDHHPRSAQWRLKVIAEAEPSALTRILQPFQSLNVIPQRLRVERIGDAYFEVTVDMAAAAVLPETQRVIIAKLSQLPTVLVAVTCD